MKIIVLYVSCGLADGDAEAFGKEVLFRCQQSDQIFFSSACQQFIDEFFSRFIRVPYGDGFFDLFIAHVGDRFSVFL